MKKNTFSMLDENGNEIVYDVLFTFENEYPHSIEQNMYNIYCDEINKRKKRNKTGKKNKRIKNGIKYL